MSAGVRRLARLLACLLVCLLAVAPAAVAKDGDGGGGRGGSGSGNDRRVEVRSAGRCGPGATSELRLRAEDGVIEIRFEVDHTRPKARWRVAFVHERRVAFRGKARTRGQSASFKVERDVADLPGADLVTARAWGPNGLSCLASARLPA